MQPYYEINCEDEPSRRFIEKLFIFFKKKNKKDNENPKGKRPWENPK